MKKIIILLTLISSLFAGGLNYQAKHIKENHPDGYNIIKKRATIKWQYDYDMVVYMINKECKNLNSIVNSFKSANSGILIKAIYKWSLDGYREKNINTWKEIDAVSIQNMVKFICDWSMVNYEYKKQSLAAASF